MTDIFDETWELDGRPYSMRDLTIEDFERFTKAGEDGSTGIRKQLAIVLVGPDGESPQMESLAAFRFRDFLRILRAIGEWASES